MYGISIFDSIVNKGTSVFDTLNVLNHTTPMLHVHANRFYLSIEKSKLIPPFSKDVFEKYFITKENYQCCGGMP